MTSERTDEDIIADTGIAPIRYTVDGREWISEHEARCYLASSGYADEADTLIEDAKRIANWRYTRDRHRYLVRRIARASDGTWAYVFHTGDCTRSEERIKALGRQRTRRASYQTRYMPTSAY